MSGEFLQKVQNNLPLIWLLIIIISGVVLVVLEWFVAGTEGRAIAAVMIAAVGWGAMAGAWAHYVSRLIA